MGDQGKIRQSSERNEVEFVDNEIDLCHTFLDVADTDADDPNAAAQAQAKAQRAYEVARVWVGTVRDAGELDRLISKLNQLKQRMDEFAK